MPKTGFFGQKPVSVISRKISPKNDFPKNDYFYIWSDAARRADYYLSFSSKRNMDV